VKDIKLPATRDASCGTNQTPPPPVPTAPGRTRPPTVEVPATPNLLPSLITPAVLTRPLGPVVTTTRGGMFPVNAFFCSGLAPNVATAVAVPKLTWGISGVNVTAVTTRVDVQLINGDSPQQPVLETLTLAQGFAPSTPLVQRDNYAGRATSIRVIRDPRFQVGAALQTVPGCFTEPGSNQALDPKVLIVKVDSGNAVNEGTRENDNELRF
jgi:hypothetical protein